HGVRAHLEFLHEFHPGATSNFALSHQHAVPWTEDREKTGTGPTEDAAVMRHNLHLLGEVGAIVSEYLIRCGGSVLSGRQIVTVQHEDRREILSWTRTRGPETRDRLRPAGK